MLLKLMALYMTKNVMMETHKMEMDAIALVELNNNGYVRRNFLSSYMKSLNSDLNAIGSQIILIPLQILILITQSRPITLILMVELQTPYLLMANLNSQNMVKTKAYMEFLQSLSNQHSNQNTLKSNSQKEGSRHTILSKILKDILHIKASREVLLVSSM